jgi:putative ABC transport system ATP-binding protein
MRPLCRLAKEEGTTVVIASHDERLREFADRVVWLEDGRLKALAALVRDPVCGMLLLDPQQAPARLEEDGSVLYFCSGGCRDQFQQERGSGLTRQQRASTPGGYSPEPATSEGEAR